MPPVRFQGTEQKTIICGVYTVCPDSVMTDFWSWK
jgi:hypothetical protein